MSTLRSLQLIEWEELHRTNPEATSAIAMWCREIVQAIRTEPDSRFPDHVIIELSPCDVEGFAVLDLHEWHSIPVAVASDEAAQFTVDSQWTLTVSPLPGADRRSRYRPGLRPGFEEAPALLNHDATLGPPPPMEYRRARGGGR